MESEYIIGIDLGTTYSCAAIWKNGKVEIIPNHETGERVIPSVVSFTEEERLIGKAAKNQITKNYINTIYDSKRLIGRKFDDEIVQKDMKLWPFKIERDINSNRPLIVIKLKNKIEKYPAERISSIILGKIKELAEEYLGGKKIKKAIITVPAYFNESQREATRDAGKIAGLEVLKIINEPTAAALAYGFNTENKGTKNIFVFDLGGGTFDVSVLTLNNLDFEVKSINGDTHLGGEDFDNLLMKYCMEEFKIQTNIDLSNNQKAMKRLKVYCEKCKKDLSGSKQSELDIDALAEGEDFNIEITRTKFEYICDDLFQKCIPPMEEALKDANLEKEDIDEVILIGGSTRIPKIKDLVKTFFNNKTLCTNINPEEAVAYGAALQTQLFYNHSNLNNINNLKITEINPISLGIGCLGDKMKFYIKKGMKIPIKIEKIHKTTYDNQDKIYFPIYQGERLFCDDNTYLCEIMINGLRLAPKGEVKFKISMELDENSILKVHAKEINGDIEKELSIQNFNDRLTEEEINKYLEDELSFKEDDIMNKKRINEIIKLENLIYENEKKYKTSEFKNKNLLGKIEEIKNWLRKNPKENFSFYSIKIKEFNSFLEMNK